jgi:N-dimethylarginine dimethylaminohydrolase
MSRLLVCPPDYFSIDYEINPWMRRSNMVDPQAAVRQWHSLMEVLERDVGAVLERMTPVPGLPDLVFTANAGVVVGRRLRNRDARGGHVFRRCRRSPRLC